MKRLGLSRRRDGMIGIGHGGLGAAPAHKSSPGQRFYVVAQFQDSRREAGLALFEARRRRRDRHAVEVPLPVLEGDTDRRNA